LVSVKTNDSSTLVIINCTVHGIIIHFLNLYGIMWCMMCVVWGVHHPGQLDW
jgi:hypothetical protein